MSNLLDASGRTPVDLADVLFLNCVQAFRHGQFHAALVYANEMVDRLAGERLAELAIATPDAIDQFRVEVTRFAEANEHRDDHSGVQLINLMSALHHARATFLE